MLVPFWSLQDYTQCEHSYLLGGGGGSVFAGWCWFVVFSLKVLDNERTSTSEYEPAHRYIIRLPY